MIRGFGAAAAFALLATSAQAAQTTQEKACLTPAEANALVLSVAPSALHAVTEACTKVLPANAYLAINGAALEQRFVAPAAAVKPAAIAAFNKISGETKIDAQTFDMVVGAMIGAMAGDKIKPADCPKVDRVLALLDPLPPANLSGLIATIVELSSEDKSSGFTICKPAG